MKQTKKKLFRNNISIVVEMIVSFEFLEFNRNNFHTKTKIFYVHCVFIITGLPSPPNT